MTVPLAEPVCGLCDKRYWTVEDDGEKTWCRRWTISECREYWDREDKHRRTHQVLRILNLLPKPKLAQARPVFGGTLIERLKARYRVDDVLGHLGIHIQRDKINIRCPLHNEQKGMAFSVDLQRQKWRCFGRCGIGGDVIDLLEELRKRGILRLW